MGRSSGGKRTYWTLFNRTDKIVVLHHPVAQVADVVLGVRGAVTIDISIWDPDDVPQLRRMLDAGELEIVESDKRRDALDPFAGVQMPENRHDAAVVREIVLTHDEAKAMEHIMMTPVNERVAGGPVDVAFLRQRQKPILQSALAALQRVGGVEVEERIKAIKDRIEEIDKMPAA